MDPELEFPALADLVSGGFNQDYEDVFGDADDVIALYTPDPVFCARIRIEVPTLLTQCDTRSLDETLSALHNGYNYPAHGQTATEFLEMVLARTEAAAPEPVAPYASLIGQPISSVTGSPVTVVIKDIAVVFTSGMRCSMIGARGLSSLQLAQSVVGHEVVWAGASGNAVTVATRTARMFTPRKPETPTFELRVVMDDSF